MICHPGSKGPRRILSTAQPMLDIEPDLLTLSGPQTCSRPGIQTSVGLYPQKQAGGWGFSSRGSSLEILTPVKDVTLNLGAPGFRTGGSGCLWLPYAGQNNVAGSLKNGSRSTSTRPNRSPPGRPIPRWWTTSRFRGCSRPIITAPGSWPSEYWSPGVASRPFVSTSRNRTTRNPANASLMS